MNQKYLTSSDSHSSGGSNDDLGRTWELCSCLPAGVGKKLEQMRTKNFYIYHVAAIKPYGFTQVIFFLHIFTIHIKRIFHYSTVYIISYNQLILKVSSVREWSKNVVQAYNRLLIVDKMNKLFSHVEYDIMNIKF